MKEIFRRYPIGIQNFEDLRNNNCVYIDENGLEQVRVNRSDGYAISQIKKTNIRQVIFSTETNKVVSRRAEKLGIEVQQGLKSKKEAVIEYCKKNKIQLTNVLFLGNDLNDYEGLKEIKGWELKI